MDLVLIKTSLGLSEDASDAEVLGRIQDLRASSGDQEFSKDSPDLQLIKAGQHEQCATNPDGSVTVTLRSPIPFGKDTIPELTLRRPKMKDLRLAQEQSKNQVAYMVTMISALSGQAPKLIDELDFEDTTTLGAVISFLQLPRQTGR